MPARFMQANEAALSSRLCTEIRSGKQNMIVLAFDLQIEPQEGGFYVRGLQNLSIAGVRLPNSPQGNLMLSVLQAIAQIMAENPPPSGEELDEPTPQS